MSSLSSNILFSSIAYFPTWLVITRYGCFIGKHKSLLFRLMEHFTNYIMRVMQNEKSDELAEFSREIHALSAVAKPVSTWFGVEALGEARRACGGHGFLYSSRLNELRDSFDPSQTFEGENYMILQQTSNILLSKMRSPKTPTPMGTFDFLYETPKQFSAFTDDIVKDTMDTYKWLIHYYLKQTATDLDVEMSKNKGCTFSARNNVQVHRAQQLSITYAELTIVSWSREFVDEVEEPSIKEVLYRLIALYGLFSLEKHLATCYMGEFLTFVLSEAFLIRAHGDIMIRAPLCLLCASILPIQVATAPGPKFGETIRQNIRQLEGEIYADAVTLVDAIAPPDFVLNSALGASDGRPYDHLMREFRKHTNPRPHWWEDLSAFLEENKKRSSKL
ncbi:Acyl-CoA oxidase [Cooperia oncophora]